MTGKKKRELKPKGYCIFCYRGFDPDAGGVAGPVGNVKRPDHATEWFHLSCYEKWRNDIRSIGNVN